MTKQTQERLFLLAHYAKEEEACFLSHLDLLRIFHRAFARAFIPVAMSRGFNPKPRLSFLEASTTGMATADEIFMVQLAEPIEQDHFQSRLQATLPKGIQITQTEIRTSKRMPQAVGASYRIQFPHHGMPNPQRITELMNAPSWMIERQRKGRSQQIDLRQSIAELTCPSQDVVHVTLTFRDGARPRIDDLIRVIAPDTFLEYIPMTIKEKTLLSQEQHHAQTHAGQRH